MIHPTAVISSKAEIDSSVDIGPYAVVEDHVRIGAGTRVMAHAYLTGFTQIGCNNEIHMGAVIGHKPQDTKFNENARSFLSIGDRNIFRENCTVHRGTEPYSSTVIGDSNFFMVGAHVAHNCHVGNSVVMCNNAGLAGHAHVADRAFISANVMISQFVHVGRMVMLSGGAEVSLDVPPFVLAGGRNEIWSINIVGLKRGGVSPESIREIKEMYKILYMSSFDMKDALNEVERIGYQSSEVKEFIGFVRTSPNGIMSHSV